MPRMVQPTIIKNIIKNKAKLIFGKRAHSIMLMVDIRNISKKAHAIIYIIWNIFWPKKEQQFFVSKHPKLKQQQQQQNIIGVFIFL